MRNTLGGLMIAMLIPVFASAQDRSDLIERARGQFDDAAALALLSSAAAPSQPPIDSLWTVSVHEIALRLLASDAAAAATWLRWSARHGARWPIDRSFFPPPLITAYDRSAADVRAGGEPEGVAVTDWRWPTSFNRTAAGTLAVTAADPASAVQVAVQGRGAIGSGNSLSLPPGTYQMTASADGFEPVTISREVLPGATTTLDFRLVPLLPSDVEAAVTAGLVSIRQGSGAQQICANGYIAQPNGLVLTALSALRATDGLEVATADGVFRGLAVVASDRDRDVAVLEIPASQRALAPAAAGAANQYVWSAYRSGCGAPQAVRSRLAAALSPSVATLLSAPLPAAAVGAPLVDRTGAVLGLVVAPDRVLATALSNTVLAQAAPGTTQPAQPQARGGGFPIKWVGGGIAAVGLAVLGLKGKGGGGSRTTGDIVITLPAS